MKKVTRTIRVNSIDVEGVIVVSINVDSHFHILIECLNKTWAYKWEKYDSNYVDFFCNSSSEYLIKCLSPLTDKYECSHSKQLTDEYLYLTKIIESIKNAIES